MKLPICSSKTPAFSLVEVVIALGLMTFALTTLLALVPTGMTSNKDSKSSMEAMRTALSVIADIRQATATNGKFLSPRYAIGFDQTNMKTSLTGADGVNQRVEVSFVRRPGTTGGENGLYEAVVKVFWGLPDSVAVPSGYNNSIQLYGAVSK